MDGATKVSAMGINTWYTSGQTKVKPQIGYYRPQLCRSRSSTSMRSVWDSYESVAPGG
jgi:hypothetical protein